MTGYPTKPTTTAKPAEPTPAERAATFQAATTGDDLKKVFAGIRNQTMRDEVVIVKPDGAKPEFVISTGSEDLAKRLAAAMGLGDKMKKIDMKKKDEGLELGAITEVPFTEPTTLKRRSHIASYSKVTGQSSYREEQLPDTKVHFSEYRIPVSPEGKVTAELFTKTFGTKVLDLKKDGATKVGEAVHDAVMASNNVGRGSRSA